MFPIENYEPREAVPLAKTTAAQAGGVARVRDRNILVFEVLAREVANKVGELNGIRETEALIHAIAALEWGRKMAVERLRGAGEDAGDVPDLEDGLKYMETVSEHWRDLLRKWLIRRDGGSGAHDGTRVTSPQARHAHDERKTAWLAASKARAVESVALWDAEAEADEIAARAHMTGTPEKDEEKTHDGRRSVWRAAEKINKIADAGHALALEADGGQDADVGGDVARK